MTEDKNLNGHPGVEVEVRGNTSTSGRSFTLASQISTQASTPLVERFSSEDFLIVIDRCESLGLAVIGVELFTTDVEPPYKAGLEDIEISPVRLTTGRPLVCCSPGQRLVLLLGIGASGLLASKCFSAVAASISLFISAPTRSMRPVM